MTVGSGASGAGGYLRLQSGRSDEVTGGSLTVESGEGRKRSVDVLWVEKEERSRDRKRKTPDCVAMIVGGCVGCCAFCRFHVT